jgi:hypothetical protein
MGIPIVKLMRLRHSAPTIPQYSALRRQSPGHGLITVISIENELIETIELIGRKIKKKRVVISKSRMNKRGSIIVKTVLYVVEIAPNSPKITKMRNT